MSNRGDELRFILEELARRLVTPDNLKAESILITRFKETGIEAQSLVLEEGHTVAKINGRLQSVPYNGLQYKITIEPGTSAVVFDGFHEYLSSKLVLDIESTDPARNKSGAMELLAKPLRSGDIDFVKFGQIGTLPDHGLNIRLIDSKHSMEITNLEQFPIDVYVKVTK